MEIPLVASCEGCQQGEHILTPETPWGPGLPYFYFKKYRNDYIWLHDCIWSYIIIYDYILYDYIWLYMTIYDYIRLYMIIYDYIWLYVHICIATSKRLKRECPGWHRWSFPIFSRFPTCLSSWAFLCMYLSSDVDHLLSHWCQLFSYLAMRQPLLDLKKRQHASVQVVKTC